MSLAGAFAFRPATELTEGLRTGEPAERGFAARGRELLCAENLPPQFPDLSKPGAVLGDKLGRDFLLEPLSERGTVALCGDGDLQRPPADNRAIVKVAMGRVVHHIAENSALPRLRIDFGVQCGHGSGGNHQKSARQIGCPERPRIPTDFISTRPTANS